MNEAVQGQVVAQVVKALAAKSDTLSSTPSTHRGVGENQLPNVLRHPYKHTPWHSVYILILSTHTHIYTLCLSQPHTLTHTDTLRCFINERDFCSRLDPQHTACEVSWFTVNHVLPAANYLHSCWVCLSALRYATHLSFAKCFMWPDSLTTGRLL